MHPYAAHLERESEFSNPEGASSQTDGVGECA